MCVCVWLYSARPQPLLSLTCVRVCACVYKCYSGRSVSNFPETGAGGVGKHHLWFPGARPLGPI